VSEHVYSVTVSIDMVVVAKSQREAEQEAESCIDVEDDGAEKVATAFRVTSDKVLPAGWCADTLPFGGDGVRTIADYLRVSSAQTGGTADD
jgi:hypothetical protein